MKIIQKSKQVPEKRIEKGAFNSVPDAAHARIGVVLKVPVPIAVVEVLHPRVVPVVRVRRARPVFAVRIGTANALMANS